MGIDLYLFTTPKEAEITLKLDSGQEIIGQPCAYDDRDDAHWMPLPDGTTTQGSELFVTLEGYERAPSDRGILVTTTCPQCGSKPHFELDDIHLQKKPDVVPEPPPSPINPATNKPLDIINAVYATGQYNLYTEEGCGLFTEACCQELHERNNNLFGHIRKRPEQNQFNGHAVDAVSCLGGEEYGVWDIIYSSASSNAKPVYNHAGDPNPEEWYYPPAPLA